MNEAGFPTRPSSRWPGCAASAATPPKGWRRRSTSERSCSDHSLGSEGLRRRRNQGVDLEGRPAEVALADYGHGKRPGDAERGVIVAVAARGLRRIKCRDLVDDLGVVGKRLKAVSEAFRNIDRASV